MSRRGWDDAHLLDAIIDVHRDDPEFGYRFIADEVHRLGHTGSENRIQRLCALQQVVSSIVRRRRGAGKRPGPAVADDSVLRNFTGQRPDLVWPTPITKHPTGESKLDACAIKDIRSRRIVGWAIDERMTSELADTALRTAITQRRPTGTVIVHSDRGDQLRSLRYQRTLRAHGIIASMGRGASAGDNAARESFFVLLQKSVLNRQTWQSREELHLAIVTSIERTYHRRRRQRALGKLTPVEFETAIGYNTLTIAA